MEITGCIDHTLSAGRPCTHLMTCFIVSATSFCLALVIYPHGLGIIGFNKCPENSSRGTKICDLFVCNGYSSYSPKGVWLKYGVIHYLLVWGLVVNWDGCGLKVLCQQDLYNTLMPSGD